MIKTEQVETNRKKIEEELVSISIGNLPEEQVDHIIKNHMNDYVSMFEKTKAYETVKVRKIEENYSTKIVVLGLRLESDTEFFKRIGIDKDSSWIYSYMNLANVSKEESVQEMGAMLNLGQVVTPEKWIENKENKVKEVLNIENKIIELTQEDFKEKTENGVFLVDFWATWCGPCKILNPVLEELQKDYEGKVVFAKVNTDEQPDLATEFAVRALPSLFVIKDGEVVDKVLGLQSKEQIASLLDKVVSVEIPETTPNVETR